MYSIEMMEADSKYWLKAIEQLEEEEEEDLPLALLPSMETYEMPNSSKPLKRLIRDMQFTADLQRSVIDALSTHIERDEPQVPSRGKNNPFDITKGNDR